MKTITLKQPWATLVAEGIKKYEFRSWKTNYRGKVLIHAGCGVDNEALKKFSDLGFEFPARKIIAIVEITDCIKVDNKFNEKIKLEKNIAYGTKQRSGYAWKLENVKKIECNQTINGKLSFWEYYYDETKL